MFGEMHAKTADIYFNYGIFLVDIKKEKKKGVEMLQNSYNLRKQILGPKHSLTNKALKAYNGRK